MKHAKPKLGVKTAIGWRLHPLAVIVLSVATINGCGLLPLKQVHFYDGPEKPVEQLAILAESNASKVRGGNYGTHITHINGKRLKPIYGGRYIDAIYLLPGEYEFTFSYFAPNYDVNLMDIEKGKEVLRVKASHRYVPKMSLSDDDTQAKFGLVDMGKTYPIECLRKSPYHPKPDNCAAAGSRSRVWHFK